MTAATPLRIVTDTASDALNIGINLDGRPVFLPADALTTTFAIIGRRGSGKTSTAVVLAEEFIRAGLPLVLLDVLGVAWGLRSSLDGEGEGLPVTILGGAHGDLPLERTAGTLVADLVIENPGAYILDLSSFESKSAERQFATDFAERLYRAKAHNPSALHIIIDEADVFAPQRVSGDDARMVGAFEAIARRGRVRGLGMTLITQRPAVLNKNVLSQVECMIAMQLTMPHDRQALKGWAEGHATADELSTFLDSLASLRVGQAWLWSPQWLQVFERIQVRQRRTFDSSATPKAGQTRIEPQVLAAVDLDTLRERMAETVERASADDPKALKAEIADLRRQLANSEKSSVVQPCNHEEAIAHLTASLDAKTRVILQLSNENHALHRFHDAVSKAIDIVHLEVNDAAPAVAGPGSDGGAERPDVSDRGVVSTAGADNRRTASEPREARESRARSSGSVGSVPAVSQPGAVGGSAEALADGPRRLLSAVAQFDALGVRSLDVTTAALMAKVGVKSSNLPRFIDQLAEAGWVTSTGKRAEAKLSLTDAGRAELPAQELPSLAVLHERWLTLLDAGPAKFLKELLAIFPGDIDKSALAQRAGVSPTSSNVGRFLGVLTDYGAARIDGRFVSATRLLFPEGVK